MSNLIKIKGRLVYDPHRPDFRKTHKMKTLIVELKPGFLANYYESFLQKIHGTGFKLHPPMFGYHVTIVSGNERIPNLAAWKKHQGKEIEIEYDTTSIAKKHDFWFLKVNGQNLQDFRAELGLSRNFPFHLTIGRES